MGSDDGYDVVVEHVYNFLKGMQAVLLPPSIIFSAIHFYKFFNSKPMQSLVTKNLTFYCFSLYLSYMFKLVLLWDIYFCEALSSSNLEYSTLYVMYQIPVYLMLQTTILKFIIALDLFLTFRKIDKYLRRPSGSQNKKFIIYCFCGTTISAFIAIMLFSFFPINAPDAWGKHDYILALLIRVIRIARLIPCFGSFWYIRSASINKAELWTKFSMHIRLIFMLGGFSAIITMTEIFFHEVIENTVLDMPPYSSEHSEATFDRGYELGIILEGILIGVLFTFKKDTFKSVCIGG